ncbi:undecaprenyl-phosphate glucose phosphotransferase [Candidatus Omnitrophota bacterium]
MLKEHSRFYENLNIICDILIISIAWFIAYLVRYEIGFLFRISPNELRISDIVRLLPVIILLNLSVFYLSGFYRSKRLRIFYAEFFEVIKLSFISFGLLLVYIYLTKDALLKEGYTYSRLFLFLFFGFQIIFLGLFRLFLRSFLKFIRKKGFNQKNCLIIGTGDLAKDFARKIIDDKGSGIMLKGFLAMGNPHKERHKFLLGFPVIGSYHDIKSIVKQLSIDQVVIAVSIGQIGLVEKILGKINTEIVDVRFVPDLLSFYTLRHSIEDFHGLPIINLRESPLYGANRVLKQMYDIAFSFVIIIFTCPLMVVIFLLLKLTSKDTPLYKQRRVGLDGNYFNIIKFRTMRSLPKHEQEKHVAARNDNRVTRIGWFLRKFNLDELPQFFNVLRGEMSIVGPRPERPYFMNKFRNRYPEYILRMKMKAGITGWAQVNGLRGRTSIRERTNYDIYYIENWSFWFDLKIILMSLFAFKNAY